MIKSELPNLHSLRAIAALMVVVAHIELRKSSLNLQHIQFVTTWGTLGVNLFFVISGFLITYLLLTEKQRFGDVSLHHFYTRRILRIWPLYFLILLFGYYLTPVLLPQYYLSDVDKFTSQSILCNIFFLSNITMILNLTPLIISPIWSIGIEEQFYIFWPIIMRINKIQVITKIVIAIIFIHPSLKLILFYLSSRYPALQILSSTLSTMKFDSMAMGGIMAIISHFGKISLFRLELKLQLFTSTATQVGAFVLLAALFTMSYYKPILIDIYQPFSAIFAICILNLATNPSSIIQIENRVLNYFGKISYGLYIYHMPVIYLIFHFQIQSMAIGDWFASNLILYTFTISSTVILAAISYEYFEKTFLKLKLKYSRLQT